MHEYRMKCDILISAMIAYTHEWISFSLYGIWWFIVFNKRDGVKLIILGNFDFHQVSMHTKVVEKMKISWKNSVSWGKWKSWLPWFQSIFRFFSKSKIDPIIWVLRFLKSKGGPFGEKNLKKIDFYVWYLKRTALNNVDWQWNRFLKILIFGEVMDQKVPKNRHF